MNPARQVLNLRAGPYPGHVHHDHLFHPCLPVRRGLPFLGHLLYHLFALADSAAGP